MSKLSKHLLILKRRVNQTAELKKMFQIENETLKNVLKAFKSAKMNMSVEQDRHSFSNCENYRKNLLSDNTEITYEIFSLDTTALVKDICKKAPSTPKWCQFLYYLVKSTDAPNVLEIGTNLGVSGSYILEAMKDKEGRFTTMEGLPQLCDISSNQFESIVPASRFNVVQGLYDDTFPQVIEKESHFDLMFIDGNHKKAPTLEYFDALKKKMNQKAVFIFDDIYWSEEMKEAWKIIRKDNDVNFSIDLYEQGIVIIDKNDSHRQLEFNLHLAY